MTFALVLGFMQPVVVDGRLNVRNLATLILVLGLGACATITQGTSQKITVNVSPVSGSCVVTRAGEQVGISTPSQRDIEISKSQHDLSFACSAPGYKPKTETLSAHMAGIPLVNVGLIDAATGAWQKYPSEIQIVLQRQ